MNLVNSEDREKEITKEVETTLRDEIIALRNEIKSLKEEIKGKEEEKIEKPIIRKVLKCYKETGVSKDLDVRRMVITPDDKYLITCSEIQLGKKPRVCVWSLDKILQKIPGARKHTQKTGELGMEKKSNRQALRKMWGKWPGDESIEELLALLDGRPHQ